MVMALPDKRRAQAAGRATFGPVLVALQHVLSAVNRGELALVGILYGRLLLKRCRKVIFNPPRMAGR